MPRASAAPGIGETDEPDPSPLRVLSLAHVGVRHGAGRARYEALARRAGVELTLVVPERWREHGATYRAEPQLGRVKVVAAPVRWLQAGPAKWYLHHYKTLGRILREARPDVIHLWEEPWSLVALQALRLRDRLLPDAALVLETEKNVLRRLPPPFEAIRRRTLRRADLLVTRQEEAEAVSRACGFEGPARCVGYGVDPSIFHPGPGPGRSRGLGSGGLSLGYVGRIVRDKGIFDILDALAAGPPDVQLALMGEGPDRARFEACAQRLGLSGRVRVSEPRPPLEVAQFMRGLDALLLPSRTTDGWKEQFGRVIIEAQACGTPVVGSSSGAIPEVVGAGGWITPEGDPAALAALFARLRADRAEHGGAERDGVAALGLSNVADRYTCKHVGEQLLDAYWTAAAVRAARRMGRRALVSASAAALPRTRATAGHETGWRKHLEALRAPARRVDAASFHGASVI